jgi:hypothetical protein
MRCDAEASPGGFRRDEDEVIENGPARLAQPEPLDQWRVLPSTQAIGQQGGTLGTLLGSSRKAAEQADRTDVGQPPEQRLENFGICGVAAG